MGISCGVAVVLTPIVCRRQLSKGDRTKIITLVTIDVHGRDVCGRCVLSLVRTLLYCSWSVPIEVPETQTASYL